MGEAGVVEGAADGLDLAVHGRRRCNHISTGAGGGHGLFAEVDQGRVIVDVGAVHHAAVAVVGELVEAGVGHQHGGVANVGAQDVFDEIVRNQVPLEEWPTYIFTRLFAVRGTADHELAALKAVAAKAKARPRGGEAKPEASRAPPPKAARPLALQ